MPQVQSLPQLASLPIDEPIGLPKASPGEFASPGATVHELGQETANLALANQAFQGHLINAQRQLTYKQIEIDVGRLEEQAHNDLSKAVTPEDAQAIHTNFNKDVDNLLSPHMGDNVFARELNLFGQQVDVQMQHTVNTKKADIITKNGRIADGILVDKAAQEAINIGTANGDWSGTREALLQKLNASIPAGIWMPEQVAAIMQKYDKKVDIGIIKAKYNSNDPAVRKDIIAQLGDDTNFPSLDDSDRAAYRVAAEKRNKELNGLRKSDDYNAAVTQFNDLTEGWPYENKANATTSNKWLKDNGFVDENGNPDHVTGDKLLEEVNRQQTAHQKATTDKDTEITSTYMSKVDQGKLSDNQIDKLVQDAGGSPKAASALKSASHQAIGQQHAAYRFGEFVKDAGHRAYTREYHDAQENGDAISADLMRRLTAGETIDMSRVWNTVGEGDMTKAQATQIEAHMNALKDKTYKYNATRIANATGLSDADKAKMTLDLLDAKQQENLQGNAMVQWTDKVIDDTSKKQTTNYIEQWFGNLKEGRNMWETPPTKPTAAPRGGIEQRSPSTGQYRHSTDGGKTWKPGQLPR